MIDLSTLHYFLGIAVTTSPTGLQLSQERYAGEIIDRARMSSCKPARTLVEIGTKLRADAETPVADPTHYGSLAYAVEQCCLHMHDPREDHLTAVKRILRYLQVLDRSRAIVTRDSIVRQSR